MEEEHQSPIGEMFRAFPHESALVMQRGIELGMLTSGLLVVHCLLLVLQFWDSETPHDRLLRGLCLIRIGCALPRPYFWCRSREMFLEARYQPSPQLVTQRLFQVYSHPYVAERGLLVFYYAWLVGVTAAACYVRMNEPQTLFAKQLWRHCLLNFMSIVLHRVFCILLFYYFVNSDFKRGIPEDVLEKYTKRLLFSSSACGKLGGDAECSICYSTYSEGEAVRKLPCGHHFHQRCVDVWLLGQKNSCPLCLHIVGPQQPG
jgi:hypothetical protein